MSTEEEKAEAAKGAKRPVGYCSPPEATRFKKGVSGNPKGRPKGSLNVSTVLMNALREKVVINENGQRKTVTKLEAAVKQFVNKAASGDFRALRYLIELEREAEAKQSLGAPNAQGLNELDRDVMEGILRRFRLDETENPTKKEDTQNEARRS